MKAAGGARPKAQGAAAACRLSACADRTYLPVPVACDPAAGQVVGCRGSLRLGEALGPEKAAQFLRVEPAACGNKNVTVTQLKYTFAQSLLPPKRRVENYRARCASASDTIHTNKANLGESI